MRMHAGQAARPARQYRVGSCSEFYDSLVGLALRLIHDPANRKVLHEVEGEDLVWYLMALFSAADSQT